MTFAMPMSTVIGMVVERFMLLATPPRHEPSPMAAGCTPAEWAVAGGLCGERPHETICGTFPGPIDTTPHDPETVAHTALQKLTARAVVERIGGLPMRYRPLVR